MFGPRAFNDDGSPTSESFACFRVRIVRKIRRRIVISFDGGMITLRPVTFARELNARERSAQMCTRFSRDTFGASGRTVSVLALGFRQIRIRLFANVRTANQINDGNRRLLAPRARTLMKTFTAFGTFPRKLRDYKRI